jgi:hypothetical protein
LDGDCIAVVGSGTVASPYRPNLIIDPDPANEAVCGLDGLLVVTDVETVDTDCIALAGDGSGANPLAAELIMDPLVTNLSVCGPNGLLTQLFTNDTACIAITGAGTVGDPIEVNPILSPDVGNVIECRANGLFVPAAPPPVIDMRCTLLHTGVCGPTILAPSAITVPSFVFIDYDYIEEAVGLIPQPCGAGPAYATTYIEVPVGGAGIYLIQATHPAWSAIGPITAGDMILRLRLWRGDTTGRFGDGIGQEAQVRYSTTSDDYNTPYLHISRTIRLFDADTISVDFEATDYNGAFAGATLDTGPLYGAGSIGPIVPETAGYPFFQMTRIGTP